MDLIDEIINGRRELGFRKPKSLIKNIEDSEFGFIFEIKKASPTLGIINEEIDVSKIALNYQNHGANGISVLTEETKFGGSLFDLKKVKETVKIPVLRKDFIFDEFQLYEALTYGADAVLLITEVLKEKTALFVEKAHTLGLECLVEVHEEVNLEYALNSPAKLIGINNRDLRTLEIDLKNTEKLIKKIPEDRLVISESGMDTREDVLRVKKAGANGVLIGSAIMKSDNMDEKIRELTGNVH